MSAEKKQKCETSFYSFKATTVDGKEVDFSSLKGKVVLVENTASLWGTTTRDYTQLNEIAEKFGASLAVLAFPCNQFGHQENTKNHEILNCLKYVRPGNGYVPNFPVFEKRNVNGADACPIFVYLKSSLPLPHDNEEMLVQNKDNILWNPVLRSDISWNFEKFLLDTTGTPFRRYSKNFETKDIASDIEALLK